MNHPAPSPAERLGLDDQLCFALYCASRKVVQAYQPHLKKMGITYPQYLVLLVLWEKDEMTVTSIGERLMLDSGTLTPLLKRMEHAGIIRREQSREDERQRKICLTEHGRSLRGEAITMRAHMRCQYGPQLAQADELRTSLQALLKTL